MKNEWKKRSIVKSYQKIIDKCMEEFEFDKVHEAMVLLDWKWGGFLKPSDIPTVPEIRDMAEHLLIDCAVDTEWSSLWCGGFVAERNMNNDFSLHFAISSASMFHVRKEPNLQVDTIMQTFEFDKAQKVAAKFVDWAWDDPITIGELKQMAKTCLDRVKDEPDWAQNWCSGFVADKNPHGTLSLHFSIESWPNN